MNKLILAHHYLYVGFHPFLHAFIFDAGGRSVHVTWYAAIKSHSRRPDEASNYSTQFLLFRYYLARSVVDRYSVVKFRDIFSPGIYIVDNFNGRVSGTGNRHPIHTDRVPAVSYQ